MTWQVGGHNRGENRVDSRYGWGPPWPWLTRLERARVRFSSASPSLLLLSPWRRLLPAAETPWAAHLATAKAHLATPLVAARLATPLAAARLATLVGVVAAVSGPSKTARSRRSFRRRSCFRKGRRATAGLLRTVQSSKFRISRVNHCLHPFLQSCSIVLRFGRTNR